MELLLYPRASGSTRAVRVWLGVPGTQAPQRQVWTLDGKSVPEPVGALRSAIPDDLLLARDQLRLFTGVFEFSGLEPGRRYAVGVEVQSADGGTARASCVAATLPESLAALGADRWFSILLVSCFSHRSYAGGAVLTRIASTLRSAEYRPDLTVFMGDQVYLDLPTFQDFPDDERWLADKFHRDYLRNWKPGAASDYGVLLPLAPAVMMPDDHEFWNNYPFASPFIGNTHTADGRQRWERAARAMAAAFQAHDPNAPSMPVRIDVPPLSLFIADTRTDRQTDFGRLMPAAAAQQMEQWAEDVARNRHIGVFVAGQSLLCPPKGVIGGGVADYELSNYSASWLKSRGKTPALGDYDRIIGALRRIMNSSPTRDGRTTPGGTALCLTGDVHWGRMLRVFDTMNNRQPLLHEIITSPVALVATPGADQRKIVGDFLSGIFGSRSAFPRHSEADEPDNVYIAGAVAGRYATVQVERGQTGDQLALLSFRARGGSIDMRLSYFPVTADPRAFEEYRWEKTFEKFLPLREQNA